MTMSAMLLPEFDHEMATTRRTLERVPDDKFDWRPHPKSLSMGALAGHVANLPTWTNYTINQDSLDVMPNGVPMRYEPPRSATERLKVFDANVAAARMAIAQASDQELLKPWSLLANGEVILTLPKAAVLRGFVMNHSIHHRAQLGVYLRLNDIPHPSMYGPSADEQGM